MNDVKLSKTDKGYSVAGSPIAIVSLFCIALIGAQTYLFLSHQKQFADSVTVDMQRIEKSQTEMNSLRIAQCHDIQRQSLDTMETVAGVVSEFIATAQKQQDAVTNLDSTVENLEGLVREQTTQFRLLIERIEK